MHRRVGPASNPADSALTIVIPTRNRPEWLARCLRSVFEHQTTTVPVVVSDNSSSQYPALPALEEQYHLTYIRQSGVLSQTDHFNACFGLVATPWIMLLHDDDELCPNVLGKIQTFLAERKAEGLVVGGVQYIDAQGTAKWEHIPDFGVFRGEEGMVNTAVPFHARSSNTILRVTDSREIAGFADVQGMAAEYPFLCHLAHSYGVGFLPELTGRYRTGHDQSMDLSKRASVEGFVEFPSLTAQLVRDLDCSSSTARTLMDSQTWGIFDWVASRWLDSDPKFVMELREKFLALSPVAGPWQHGVRRKYPLVFLRPNWLALWLLGLKGGYSKRPNKRSESRSW